MELHSWNQRQISGREHTSGRRFVLLLQLFVVAAFFLLLQRLVFGFASTPMFSRPANTESRSVMRTSKQSGKAVS
jgi:hypothetical protein